MAQWINPPAKAGNMGSDSLVWEDPKATSKASRCTTATGSVWWRSY